MCSLQMGDRLPLFDDHYSVGTEDELVTEVRFGIIGRHVFHTAGFGSYIGNHLAQFGEPSVAFAWMQIDGEWGLEAPR